MPKRTVKVFIASPGDLAVERRAFKDTIELLNKGFGDGARVEFVPLGWEDTLAQTGRRVQSVINADVDACDVFILVLHRRWGQAAPDSEYSSYTEEEFQRALARWRQSQSPEIFVFFKNVEAEAIADPGPQLVQVLSFRRQLTESSSVLYRFFDDAVAFKGEVDRHLRTFCRGDLPKPTDPTPIVLPVEHVMRVERAEAAAREHAERAEALARRLNAADAEREAAIARASELALTLAGKAADAARAGHIEEARQLFAQAVSGTSHLPVLYLACEFYIRTGEMRQAEQLLLRRLAAGDADAETSEIALAYDTLGIVRKHLGDLSAAETMHRRALAISENLGDSERIANASGNLSNVFLERGDLTAGEDLLRKCLDFHERAGNLEKAAVGYTNLGVILSTRDDLRGAEAMHRRALELHEKSGNLDGIGTICQNLGADLLELGDLDGAGAVTDRALDAFERLGNAQGISGCQVNKGRILDCRGDKAGAEAAYRHALATGEASGVPLAVAKALDNLGSLLVRHGELSAGEDYLRKALAINESLGRLDGIASSFGGLALASSERGALKEAEQFARQAIDAYEQLGRPVGLGAAYCILGGVLALDGQHAAAFEAWTTARGLYERAGRQTMADDMQRRIDELRARPEPQ